MRRRGAALALLLIALGLVAAAPSAVSACSSDHPTFLEAVRGARAIARVTILEGFDIYTDDPTTSETYRVDRLLKGTLPGLVTVAPAWTSLCHDSVGYYAGDEASDGKTVLVAIDMPYYDQTIHPMWMIDETQGVVGSAGVPAGVTTLEALEAAILAEVGVPATSTDEGEATGAAPLVALFAVALVAIVGIVLRFLRRRPT